MSEVGSECMEVIRMAADSSGLDVEMTMIQIYTDIQKKTWEEEEVC